MVIEFHASFFGDGNDLSEKVLEVLPEGNVGVVDVRSPVYLFVCVPGCRCPATYLDMDLGLHPPDAGHPVVTHYGDPNRAAVVAKLLEFINVLVAVLLDLCGVLSVFKPKHGERTAVSL